MNNFNFDLERMEKAVEGESTRIPFGMRGAELKAFLSNLSIHEIEPIPESLVDRIRALRQKAEINMREEALPKPTDVSVEEAFGRVFDKYKGAFEELSKGDLQSKDN